MSGSIAAGYPPLDPFNEGKMLAPPRDLSLSVKPSGSERFPTIPQTYGLANVRYFLISNYHYYCYSCQKGAVSHIQICELKGRLVVIGPGAADRAAV